MNLLKFKELVRDRGLQNTQVDPISCIQVLRLEFSQSILETPQPLQLSVQREPTEIIRPTIVLVKSKASGEKGAGVQIPFDEFFRNCGKLSIGILRSAYNRSNYNKAERKNSNYHLAEAGR